MRPGLRDLLTPQQTFLDPSSVIVFAAMVTAGATPNVADQIRVDRLIKRLKAIGAWAIADAIYDFASHASAAALINLKAPGTFNATLVDPTTDVTFTAYRGFTTNGTDNYIDSNFNPATAGGNFVRDSASFGFYQRSGGQMVAGGVAGWTDAGNIGVNIQTRSTTDLSSSKINCSTAGATAASTNGIGWWIATRTGASTNTLRKNGALQASPNITSQPLVSNNLYFGRVNATVFNACEFSLGLISSGVPAANQPDLAAIMLSHLYSVSAA